MKKRKSITIILSLIVIGVLIFPAFLMAGEKLNLNNADSDNLILLKGIGPSLAQRIVEYREKNGPFEKIEDVMKVKGISQKKFELIMDAIMVE